MGFSVLIVNDLLKWCLHKFVRRFCWQRSRELWGWVLFEGFASFSLVLKLQGVGLKALKAPWSSECGAFLKQQYQKYALDNSVLFKGQGRRLIWTLFSSPVEPGPQDTLLHFAAKRGLRKVALFLLQQPGGREALRLPNKQGRTPARVAQKKGHSQLQKLLTE